MCDGEKVRHAWIYGGVCEIRPPVYSFMFRSLEVHVMYPSYTFAINGEKLF